MGIFKPTKIKGDIIVYTKWCIECEHPEWLLAINLYALHNNLDVQVIRTQYKPADHNKAAELWSSRSDVKEDDAEKYSTFVVHDGIYTMKEYLEMISDTKDKLVKEGKTKDDMQGLPEAKRSKRKDRMGNPTNTTRKKDERSQDEQ